MLEGSLDPPPSPFHARELQARIDAALEAAVAAKEAKFRRLRWSIDDSAVELPSLATDAFHLFLSCATASSQSKHAPCAERSRCKCLAGTCGAPARTRCAW